jgi:hypothetical protein
VQKIVEWSPAPTREGLLRFDHAAHRDEVRTANDDPLECATCHALASEPATVVRPDPARCFAGHGGEHYAAETNCASCHRPLSGARAVMVAAVGAFVRPPWHDEPDFAGAGHGAHCPRDGDSSCAVCHATQFCQICHVDAPENEAIRALGDDARSLALHAELRAPTDHATDSFLVEHGHQMDGAACETCHTQESCSTCHVAGTNVASRLHRASPERGVGAVVERRMPPSHTAWFREAHGAEASANAQNCAGCHARDQCLDCHLPGAADATSRYHDLAFLARHPSAAYGRETSCADCHNPVTFCASCHQSSGLVAMRGRLGSGYHDGQESFLFGHGPAARRTLETCVSCHT